MHKSNYKYIKPKNNVNLLLKNYDISLQLRTIYMIFLMM